MADLAISIGSGTKTNLKSVGNREMLLGMLTLLLVSGNVLGLRECGQVLDRCIRRKGV